MACSSSDVSSTVDLAQNEFLMDFETAAKIHFLELIDPEAKKIKLYIAGPENTPYDKGSYEVEITFGDNYPNALPEMVFITPIWNTLVDPHNFMVICDQDQKLSISDAMDYIERVMKSVNSNQDSWCYMIARYWACEFAGKPATEEDKFHNHEVELLIDMGFDQMKALIALSHNNWDMELATEHLLHDPQEGPLLPIQQDVEEVANEEAAEQEH